MKLIAIENASGDDLYYLQPDGRWKKGGDGRSKGKKKSELPKHAEIAYAGFEGNPADIGYLGNIKYDQKNGIGNIPYNQDIAYKGFACIMTAKKFLQLTPPRNFDVRKFDFKGVAEQFSTRGISSPSLFVDFRLHDPVQSPKVVDHDGRGRATTAQQLYGDDVPLLVQVHVQGGKARDLTPAKIQEFIRGCHRQNASTYVPNPCRPQVWYNYKWDFHGVEG